jgi:1,4-dihydroxy-2-naphthoate octaprenyltransferase
VTEPTSTAIGAAGCAAVSLLLAVMLGAQVDALLLGLIGSFIAVAWFDELNSMRRAAASVAAGALACGLLSGLLAVAMWSSLPSRMQSLIDAESLRMPIALVIGFLVPSVGPVLKRRAERIARGGGDRS